MANYILSNANRFYVALETSYGIPAPISAWSRLAASSLHCHQTTELTKRRDKTGARTYLGSSAGASRRSAFELSAHLVSWNGLNQPPLGPLVQATMGAGPETVQGLSISATNGAQIQTQGPNGLVEGSAVSDGSEIRFVNTIQNPTTATLNAPFSVSPPAGSTLAPTVGYRPATQLPSVSLYDYWDPFSAVSRLVAGAGVDKLQIEVKGDVHELTFSGPAADVLDSASGAFGVSTLTAFPSEPALLDFGYSIVDGHLGQVWLGAPLNQIFALTQASVEINNNLQLRREEFGSAYPSAIVPGPREIISSFTIFAQGDAPTQALYAAAKMRTPVSALIQLGQQTGEMMAVYLPNVVPELPLFDDSEPYLLWEFKSNLGQGVANDEAFIAFA